MQQNIYIGFDFDGVLETPDIPIPKRLIKQLHLLEKSGIRLFLASGRDYAFLSKYISDIELNFWMVCAENGAHIVIPTKKIDILAPKSIHLSRFKINVHKLFLPHSTEEFKQYMWFKRFDSENDTKVAEQIIKDFIIANKWNLNVFTYPDNGLDVIPTNVNKTRLLKFIPLDTTIYYFGDGNNDLELLKHERIKACTVSNAIESVKNCVLQKNGVIAEQQAGYGVLKILIKLFNN